MFCCFVFSFKSNLFECKSFDPSAKWVSKLLIDVRATHPLSSGLSVWIFFYVVQGFSRTNSKKHYPDVCINTKKWKIQFSGRKRLEAGTSQVHDESMLWGVSVSEQVHVLHSGIQKASVFMSVWAGQCLWTIRFNHCMWNYCLSICHVFHGSIYTFGLQHISWQWASQNNYAFND